MPGSFRLLCTDGALLRLVLLYCKGNRLGTLKSWHIIKVSDSLNINLTLTTWNSILIVVFFFLHLTEVVQMYGEAICMDFGMENMHDFQQAVNQGMADPCPWA